MSTRIENRTNINPAGVRTIDNPIKNPVISQTRQEVFDKNNIDIFANKRLPPIPGMQDQDNLQIATGEEYNKLRSFEDQYTPYEEPTYNPLDFYSGSGEFNLALFNKVYREEQRRKQAYFRELEEQRLRELNKEPPPPKLHQLAIGQHLINMKESFIGLIYDFQSEPLSPELFLKQNRLFYLGLLLLIFYILYLVIRTFIPEEVKSPEPANIRIEMVKPNVKS